MQGMRKSPRIWKSGGGHTVYLITFYAGEGTCETAFAYTDVEGKLSALPEATRDNYDFDGWFTPSGEQVTTETVFTADTVLTAQWTYNPVCTITVTGEGATGRAYYAYLYMPDKTTVTTAGTYQAKVGETIRCYVKYNPGGRYVVVNGVSMTLTVADTTGGAYYDYTVSKNVTIKLLIDSQNSYSWITITES